METILFSVGSHDVSTGLALAAIGAGILLSVLAILIAQIVNGKKKLEQAAQVQIERFKPLIADQKKRLDAYEAEIRGLRETNTELEARAAALQAQMQEQQKKNDYIQSQMKGQFRLLAEEVLTSHGEKFSRQNREQVDSLLKPLAEKISEFQKQSHEGAARLAEQMNRLAQDSLRMSEEANNLTRALKGNTQAQGAWGEMILSSILEKSGLREGEQFLTQQSHRTAGGTRVRTDVEVLFPNDDRLIIDSKVSLSAFEAYSNCQDEEERDAHLRAHVQSVRSHIKTLGSKDYQVHARSGLNYVMMFIPIEGAFSAAFEAQPDLIDFAIRQNVYITTPTTLMVALRTVANVWDTENRNKNAEKIAERAGALYDKVAGFLASMDRVEKSLGAAQRAFDDARGQLNSGPGNVVRQVEMLRELGAKNSKLLPAGWEGETDGQTDGPAEETLPGFLPAQRRETSQEES